MLVSDPQAAGLAIKGKLREKRIQIFGPLSESPAEGIPSVTGSKLNP